jgi:hypothetical protein
MQLSAVPFVPKRGRPRKFATPSRAITLTLPEDVIDVLGTIDADISRAVVRLVQPELASRPHKPAELASFGRHAVILVKPTRTLKDRVGVELVPLPDGRALISFGQATTIAELELKIADALDDRRLTRADRATFEAIAEILRTARRSNEVTLLERNIIVLEARRRTASGSRETKRPERTRTRRAGRLT